MAGGGSRLALRGTFRNGQCCRALSQATRQANLASQVPRLLRVCTRGGESVCVPTCVEVNSEI